ncbi:MAG: SusE domain-containing protein [Tannerellaceae bacterium]|nr:SusE domain-containing protein [Tannerellaceae bacterium]MCD8262815.1 SusE domain-containing protein [Tannerellaceae bacterium]
MKALFIKTTCLLAFALFIVGCSDNMEDTDKRLATVNKLVEPLDGAHIELEPSFTATTYFEWDFVNPDEAGTVLYQLAFDKEDGDFSNPIYVMNSDNNGYLNYATITHKQLNTIAGMAGYSSSATGNIKWTVFSSKGLNSEKSSQINTLTITRLAGFDELPIDVWITGDASEGGTDLSKAQKMKSVTSGEFEVYTYLKAGQSFYFTDQQNSSGRKFYTIDGLVKEDGETTVSTEGIYRIVLDFNIGASTYTLVTRIGFYFCPSDEILFDLPYEGYGVFRATGQTVTFQEESWDRDQRYKFRMFVKENGGAAGETEWEWATLNGTDSAPNSDSPASYYYLQLLESTSQWDDKWKLMDMFDGVPATYTIYLQADQPYTHSISL